MSVPTLEVDGAGLRARLDEPTWAAVVAATGLDLQHVALRPLADAEVGGSTTSEPAGPAPDPALVEAARLALGPAPVAVTLVTGAGDRGLLARLGADAASLAVATRVLVPAVDGSGPVGVPGVEVSANVAGNAVVELLRLLPPGGQVRHVPDHPVVLPADESLVLAKAIRDGDDDLARAVAEECGLDEVPEVLTALAHGSAASVQLTVDVAGSRTQALRQWLLTDVGWVSLGLHGRDAVHVARSRDEVRDELVHLLADAFDTALAGGAR